MYLVEKHRYNYQNNSYELINKFYINNQTANLCLFISCNSKPIEKFYEFRIFNSSGFFHCKIFSRNPFLFDYEITTKKVLYYES